MNRHRKITTALCAALLGNLLTLPVMGQVLSTRPMEEKEPGMKEIQAALDQTMNKLNELVPSPKMLGDAKFRKENGEKVAPILMKLARLKKEIATNPQWTAMQHGRGMNPEMDRLHILGIAMALGDKDAEKILTEAAASKDATQVIHAKLAIAVGNWIMNSEDAKAQQKVLDDCAAIAKANPEDDAIALTLIGLTQIGSANQEMPDKVIEVIRANLTGNLARTAVARWDVEKTKKNTDGKPQGQ